MRQKSGTPGSLFYHLSFLRDVYTQQPVKQFDCYWNKHSTPNSWYGCQYLSELQLTVFDQRTKFMIDHRFEEEPPFEYPIRNRGWVLCEDPTNRPDHGT